MKKKLLLFCFMLIGLAMQSQTLSQSMLVDFGNNTATPSPDANGNSWNNLLSGALNTSISVNNTGGAATGYSLVVSDDFVNNYTNNNGGTGATVGSGLNVNTATQDYLFVQSDNTTGAVKFKGLNPARGYKFYIFSGRNTTLARTTNFTVTGLTTATGSVASATASGGNLNTLYTTAVLYPTTAGEITIAIAIGTPNASPSYAYINALRMEEYTDMPFVAVSSVAVTGNNITSSGQTSQMTATVSPANATDTSVNWTVDNTAVAIISNTGLLTPVNAGTVTVKATSVSNPAAFSTAQITVAPQIRQLYFSGSATENGDNPATAIPMKLLTGTNNASTNTFEIYTSLSATGTFKFYTSPDTGSSAYGMGGSAGTLALSGPAIDPAESGTVRITVNLSNNTYTILPITKWSVVGSSIANGWSGDEPLAYQGNGVWKGTIDMSVVGTDTNPRFVFRANGNWSYSFKKITGSDNKLVFESQAAGFGIAFQDIDLDYGHFTITLDLKNYTYSIQCVAIDNNEITFIGSSGLNGVGATNYEGYAFKYAELLAQRSQALGTSPFTRVNKGINGNNTTNVLARYEKDVLGTCGKYVVYGLVLGNEGIHETGQVAFNSYGTNLQLLVQKARAANKIPVVMNNYIRDDYNATDYNYIKQMNLMMAQWDVPTTNMLGAVDSGTGHWANGYKWDDLHPNDLGHAELFYAQVPSLFDVLEAGKPLPTLASGTYVTPAAGSAGALSFTPENIVHSITNSIEVRTNGTGTIMTLVTASGNGTVSINANGFAVYTSPSGATITGSTVVNDGSWHKIALTHFYARGETLLYTGGTLSGSLNEQIVTQTIKIHGDNAPATIKYKNWFFWRSGMNDIEMAAVNSGLLLKSSLELYAPLDGQAVYGPNPYVNRAQSSNTINSAAFALCVASGDQTTYGQDQWIGYVYTGVGDNDALETAFDATYSGYVTQTADFDQDLGSGAISGANLCGTYADRFAVRYKMHKTFAPGFYTITTGGDDAFRFSMDGGNTFMQTLSSWNLQPYTVKTAVVFLNGAKDLVFEYYEHGNDARASISIQPLVCQDTVTYNGSWSGTPDAYHAVIVASDLTVTDVLEACSLTVLDNATLTIADGGAAKVSNIVTVLPNGHMTVKSGGALLQLSNTPNIGSITVERDVNIRRLEYVYWGSPVDGQNLADFSPATLQNRIYTMAEATDDYIAMFKPLAENGYGANPLTYAFEPAKGYMVRAPNTFQNAPAAPQLFTGKWNGTPRNGDYSIAVTKDGNGFNFLGNPYPSPVNTALFLQQNPGTLYFWTHLSFEGGNGNYAISNLSGNTVASVPASVNTGGNTISSETPNGFIQTGQGFFFHTAAAGTVTYTNAMRAQSSSNQFFRNAQEGKSRLWLNLSDAAQGYNQIMIGYMDNVTTGFDAAYDGQLLSPAITALSSLVDTEKMSIQARPLPLQEDDVVPLHFTAETAGTFTISLDHADGIFSGDQNIYLKDLMTNTIHDLKAQPYTFASEAGSFAARFQVVYANNLLGTPQFEEDNLSVYVQQHDIHINATSAILSTEVYDVRGRLLYASKNTSGNEMTISGLQAQNQLLLLKVTTDKGSFIRKLVL